MLRAVCTGAQVQRLKESRLIIRRDGDLDPVSSEEVKERPVIYIVVPTALLVRVQRLRNDLYNAIKGPSTIPIVLSMFAGSY